VERNPTICPKNNEGSYLDLNGRFVGSVPTICPKTHPITLSLITITLPITETL
jgi:hypothetical protein